MIPGRKINSILLQPINSFAYQTTIKYKKNLTLIVDWLSWLSEKVINYSDYENATLKYPIDISKTNSIKFLQ